MMDDKERNEIYKQIDEYKERILQFKQNWKDGKICQRNTEKEIDELCEDMVADMIRPLIFKLFVGSRFND